MAGDSNDKFSLVCEFPRYIKSMKGVSRCGNCLPCKLLRRREWTFRILMEAETYASNIWCCLTYNEESLPKNASLDRAQFDKFRKRLEKAYRLKYKVGIRWFAVGEYGSKDARPHYHFYLFGGLPADVHMVQSAWSDPVSGFPYGFVTLDARHVDIGNAAYTAGYTVKKMNRLDDPRLAGREPEFRTYSKGIGRGFADAMADQMRSVSGQNYIDVMNDIPKRVELAGKSLPIPRYMRERVLKKLGIEQLCKDHAYGEYQKQMQGLRRRSKAFTPPGASQAYAMESTAKRDAAQKVLNTKASYNLYNTKDRNNESDS